MKKSILFTFCFIAVLSSCEGSEEVCIGANSNCDAALVISDSDSAILSVAFVGCNRIDRHDTAKTWTTNSSSVNLAVLEHIMQNGEVKLVSRGFYNDGHHYLNQILLQTET